MPVCLPGSKESTGKIREIILGVLLHGVVMKLQELLIPSVDDVVLPESRYGHFVEHVFLLDESVRTSDTTSYPKMHVLSSCPRSMKFFS